MSESMMTCSSCGKQFPTIEAQIGDAGNPLCPDCFHAENDESEEKK